MFPVETAERLGNLVLSCIHREYPSHVVHLLHSDADARPPRELTPTFFGSFDWHSAVHGHWSLVRLLRLFPRSANAAAIAAALATSFTPENLSGELAYLNQPGRETFERPYGLAWLLQLTAELREWGDPRAEGWLTHLLPLEAVAAERFTRWLPKLSHPVRSGEHSQTAFAMGLAHDWAYVAGDSAIRTLLEQRTRDFYGDDHEWPLRYEPSGHDFLSPSLAEADLMRRILPRAELANWLGRFLPELRADGLAACLPPVRSADPSEGKLAHLDGLNLSRAWMLEGIASALAADDTRRPEVLRSAEQHGRAGLAAVTGEHYAGAHWLGTFAVYLLSRRGIEASRG